MKIWDIAALTLSLSPYALASSTQGTKWVDVKSHGGKDDTPYLVKALKVRGIWLCVDLPNVNSTLAPSLTHSSAFREAKL